MVTTHLTHTPRVDGQEPCRDVQASCCLKTEHGVCLLDFVRQVFGKLEVVLESNTQIFF